MALIQMHLEHVLQTDRQEASSSLCQLSGLSLLLLDRGLRNRQFAKRRPAQTLVLLTWRRCREERVPQTRLISFAPILVTGDLTAGIPPQIVEQERFTFAPNGLWQ